MASSRTKHPEILVVEDEGIVRLDTVDMLRRAGFAVIEAANADEALTEVARRPDISVVFTDVHMPVRMDGVELARRVHRLRPAIHLILTSGKAALSKSDVPDDVAFIPKPYSCETVTRTVNRMLA